MRRRGSSADHPGERVALIAVDGIWNGPTARMWSQRRRYASRRSAPHPGPRVKLISKKDLDEAQLDLLEARFGFLKRQRPLLVVALIAFTATLLVGDQAVWRRWLLGLLGAGALLGSVAEMLRSRARRVHQFADRRNWWVAPLLSGALFLATGGVDSPLLPIASLVCFFIGTLSAARRMVALTAAFSVTVLALALTSWRGAIPDLMPVVFGGGPGLPQPPALLWAKAGGLVLTLVWAAVVSTTVRDVFRQIVGDAVDARDEVLAEHAEHVRELTALSRELAHELKNPLANMKGLAVLVGRSVEGKGVERLAVLQQEIARMEEILHGFLTFARPLLPLSLEEVEFRELCRSVTALHDGVARTRGVRLALEATRVRRAVCDPRRVKQILINVIQNALDVSAPGTTVELVLGAASDAGVRIEVRDRGTGIAPAVRAHLFEPGWTTKERGSGLGLALARGLARQHGGELELLEREGGGCVAVLTLPALAVLCTGEVA